MNNAEFLELLLIVGGIAFIFTELIVPSVLSRPLFPTFRMWRNKDDH